MNGKGARLKNLSGHTSNTFVNFNKEMEKKHEKDVLQNDDRVYVGRAAQAVAQSTDNMKQDQSQQDQMKHDDMSQGQMKKDEMKKDKKAKKTKKDKMKKDDMKHDDMKHDDNMKNDDGMKQN